MRDSLIELFLIPRDLACAAWDKVSGRNRKRFEHTLFVRAPRARVWEIANSLVLVSEHVTAGNVKIEPHPTDPRLHLVTLYIAGETLLQTVRVIEERQYEGYVIEIVAELSDPRIVWGNQHYAGTALSDAPGGTLLTQFAEMTFTAPYARVLAPYTVRDLARRTKRLAEAGPAVRT